MGAKFRSSVMLNASVISGNITSCYWHILYFFCWGNSDSSDTQSCSPVISTTIVGWNLESGGASFQICMSAGVKLATAHTTPSFSCCFFEFPFLTSFIFQCHIILVHFPPQKIAVFFVALSVYPSSKPFIICYSDLIYRKLWVR